MSKLGTLNNFQPRFSFIADGTMVVSLLKKNSLQGSKPTIKVKRIDKSNADELCDALMCILNEQGTVRFNVVKNQQDGTLTAYLHD